MKNSNRIGKYIGKVSVELCVCAVLCLINAIMPIAANLDANAGLDANASPKTPALPGHYGTCYEVFVYSFYDSDGDGIGDLKGLMQKLDYINDGNEDTDEDLECSMIWMMPVFPSPTYHKYDVTDYLDIDPQYGTLEDFDDLVHQCHERGVQLILDLPLNHTSTDHPWFEEASAYIRLLEEGQEPSVQDCPYVDYYNFSREKLGGYEPLEDSGWFYEARFWAGMPDLNLDSETVKDEIHRITSFWLDHGVDGFRLDAVTSYYTEDKSANIAFLSWLNDTVKADYPNCYFVGEAWTDPDTYTQYYGSGIDSLFDFAFAGQEGIIASVVKGNRGASYYGEKLAAEEELIASYGEQCMDAPFYTNHDMARSAGYYTKESSSRVKLAQALNLLMPGNAFLYYGEELGMKGSGKDENKRAPMYWSEDPEAEGMCAGPEDMDEVKMKFDSLELQREDASSIYSYVRSVIHIRNRYPVIMTGRSTLIENLSGKEICALLRKNAAGDQILLVINSSKEDQKLSLQGTDFENWALTDMLCVSEEPIRLGEGKLLLPAFGIALLQV